MEYSNEFKNLLLKSKERLIGWGNPNANILIIGKESAIPKDNNPIGKEQYEREIVKNYEFWVRNDNQGISLDDVAQIQFFDGTDIIKNIGDYNPLYPYKGQLNRVRRVFRDKKGEECNVIGKRGTSKTWYNYQYLSDLIFREVRTSSNGIIDFHRHIFTTELSDVAAPTSNEVSPTERLKSIEARKVFFGNDFFKRFPIIIVAAGDYPRRFGISCENFWGEPFQKKESGSLPKGIYEILSKDNPPRLYIRTYQLSMVSRTLIEAIASKCKEFKNNHNITLI